MDFSFFKGAHVGNPQSPLFSYLATLQPYSTGIKLKVFFFLANFSNVSANEQSEKALCNVTRNVNASQSFTKPLARCLLIPWNPVVASEMVSWMNHLNDVDPLVARILRNLGIIGTFNPRKTPQRRKFDHWPILYFSDVFHASFFKFVNVHDWQVYLKKTAFCVFVSCCIFTAQHDQYSVLAKCEQQHLTHFV